MSCGTKEGSSSPEEIPRVGGPLPPFPPPVPTPGQIPHLQCPRGGPSMVTLGGTPRFGVSPSVWRWGEGIPHECRPLHSLQ